MQIEYTNVKDYLFFLIEKYEPNHYESISALCLLEQAMPGTSINRLLTLVVAVFEQSLSSASPLLRAASELLEQSYKLEAAVTVQQRI